ncbi:ATP-binding protein [Granulicella sp. dw_53]|uniref:ATP-binding protein n=1 Tax=Granulicella sp. dw_53 TaxID=2719792 RepID=UPI001C4A4DC8|nr:ATP-binding protein [Granulicella sp. dw_53]
MKHWRVRTTLMVSLLVASLGLTATCLLIIRVSVQQAIQTDLNSDLEHSLDTFRNIARQRNQMLAREAALLADLPSLKALMATQDAQTIEDGSREFWKTSGSDVFALVSASGKLMTYSNRGAILDDVQVTRGLQDCMIEPETSCMVAFGRSLYEISIQPLYFGPPANGTRLGYVVIGYAIDHQVALQVSEAAAADVSFLVDGDVSASTLTADRFAALKEQSQSLDATTAAPRKIQLNGEVYIAAASSLPPAGQGTTKLVVLKSYDQASEYLRRVNRWVVALGIAALLIGLLLAAALSRAVTRPLEMLVAGARALGQGDFNYRLNIEGAAEVRELALAFDRMRGELKRTQKELLESDRLATIGRMASSVSHDLRHHLSAIYANAEFMSLAQTGKDERVELHLEIKEAVQSMTDLIESLLLFSQTGQVLNLRFESVRQLLERGIHSVSQHPDCRDVEIQAPYLESVDAWIDGKKLGRAFYNLLLNACQAAKSGTEPPSVTVTLSEDEDKVRISIRDSGPGVPNSIRRTLFQPFVSAGKENGVGLGLTLAQHVAQEHGGEVKLEESIPGRTVFTILLYKQALQTFGARQASAINVIQEQIGAAGVTGYDQL